MTRLLKLMEKKLDEEIDRRIAANPQLDRITTDEELYEAFAEFLIAEFKRG